MFGFAGLALLAPAVGHSANLFEKLSELGYPNTCLCRVDSVGHALNKTMVLRYVSSGDKAEDRETAIELLGLLVNALNDTGHRFFSFEASARASDCDEAQPQFSFWRDFDGNWRLMSRNAVSYLKRVAKNLSEEQRQTAIGGYVDYSLALALQRSGQYRRSIDAFENAHESITEHGDPYSIEAFVLAPLIQYYLRNEKDEDVGERYLIRYAHVVNQSELDSANYVPLI